MLASTVGWAIAGAYAAMGFAIAVGAGIALRKFAKPSLTEVTQVKSLNSSQATTDVYTILLNLYCLLDRLLCSF